jgi:polar amino acid transport system substrate-binding protein
VEMMNAFCKKIAVTCEFISSKWDGIIPGLLSGKYDVIASGMTITEERAKTVLFSDPYYDAGLRAMLNKKSAAASIEELDKKENSIAVKVGTTGDIFAGKTFKIAKIMRLDSEADAAQVVVNNQAQAFIYDQPYVDIFAADKGDKVRVLPVGLTKEQLGLASVKKSQDLIDAFNAFLKEYRSSGAYDKSYKDNFVDLTWKKHFPKVF